MPTLEQVNAAMAAVDTALQDINISQDMEDALNDLSNVLQRIQNATIAGMQQSLVNALAANNADLQALNKKIADLSAELDRTAATFQSLSRTLGTVVSAVTALILI
ncbi:MAG TPA: hypothetical protein VGN20_07570 [Mucilaginibacter sp.]|jgi:chromosome segregation ATPase